MLLGSAEHMDDLVSAYNNTLTALMETGAPERQKIITVKDHAPPPPWFNANIETPKRAKRNAEKQ